METTKELIAKINRAFSENNMETFLNYLADDIVWEMHSSSSGHTTLTGKSEIRNMDPGNMPEQMNFQFGTIVVEGDVAAVEGTGSGTTPDGKQYTSNFCDIYHFKKGQIVKLSSFVIDNIA